MSSATEAPSCSKYDTLVTAACMTQSGCRRGAWSDAHPIYSLSSGGCECSNTLTVLLRSVVLSLFLSLLIIVVLDLDLVLLALRL